MRGSRNEVDSCREEGGCDMGFGFDRWNDGKYIEKEVGDAIEAIRECCYECNAGRWKDIINCDDPKCPLYSLRPKRRYKL